jgi:hypothetical protein
MKQKHAHGLARARLLQLSTHLYAVLVVVVDGYSDDLAAAGFVVRVVELRDVRVRQSLCRCQPLAGVELRATTMYSILPLRFS